LEAGDILLTEGGDPDKLGRGAIWRGEIDDCIHQNHIFRVRLHDGGFRPDYVSALLGSAYGKRYFLKAAKQTTGIASINRTQLGHFPVIRAPWKSQEWYSAAVLGARTLRDRLGDATQAVDWLLDSLAQRAFRQEVLQC
jgi:type I restriction enzyme S subunit